MLEEMEYDEAVIEEAFRKYFELFSFYIGEVYFNILPQGWKRLERKTKIQHVLS
ncbi:hypothetical protein ACFS7Z_08570 [Pontibacter toksunensis]|uniref:Uncharacterized protein n=1 Tax=Pontibacter toksunensis TaxID=1332631 RepID=A0ABW6BVH2_9BACT